MESEATSRPTSASFVKEGPRGGGVSAGRRGQGESESESASEGESGGCRLGTKVPDLDVIIWIQAGLEGKKLLCGASRSLQVRPQHHWPFS